MNFQRDRAWNASRSLRPCVDRLARIRPWGWHQYELPEPTDEIVVGLLPSWGRVMDTDPPVGEYEHLARLGVLTEDELRVGADLAPLPPILWATEALWAAHHRRHCSPKDGDRCIHGYPAFGSTAPGPDLDWIDKYGDAYPDVAS